MNKDKEILFDPFPRQKEFLTAIFSKKYDIILYGGGIRGGKTFAGLGALLMLCQVYPKSKWVVARKDSPTLSRTTIPSFNKIVPQNFIKKFNHKTNTVIFKNDSEIMFFGEQFASDKELNRWRGLEVNGFLLEEINELQEISFFKAIERAGSWIIDRGRQPKPIVIATCNPSQGWVKEKFYDRWKNNTLPEKWKYIPAKIFDNPFVPKDYLESLKALPTYEYEVFVNGDWEIQPKTGYEFYKEFNTDVHIKDVKYDPKQSLHLTLDFNVVPFMSATAWQIERNGNGWVLRCLEEFTTRPPKNNTIGLAVEFKKKYFSHQSSLFYYGDPSGKNRDTRTKQGSNDFTILHNELKEFYPTDRVLRSHPSATAKGSFINSLFRGDITDCRIEIDRGCKEFIKDLTNLKEDADGSKLKQRETKEGINYEKYGHLSDGMDYFICKILEVPYREHIGKRRKLLS